MDSIVPWQPQPNNIYHMDALTLLRHMPDNSVDLIVTDPPYFRFVENDWDRQWKRRDDFIQWLRQLLEQMQRVLVFNGSLYMFAGDTMAAHVEVAIADYFSVLNSIVWHKPMSHALRADRSKMRSFIPVTERLVFAEHFNSDNSARGETSYYQECDKLRGFVFEPLRAYLDGERRRAQISKAAINEACGFAPIAGAMASRHYFSNSQWCLPTREHYEAMQRLFNSDGRRGFLTRTYEDLRAEYEDLRAEYEDLRRPFNLVGVEDGERDVWRFYEPNHTLNLHRTQKPLNMIEHIVRVSSKPNALVLDPFMGSGTTAVAAQRLGRQYIGCDISAEYVEIARRRVQNADPYQQTTLGNGLVQKSLFAEVMHE